MTFARLERIASNSFMTVPLPYPMEDLNEIQNWVIREFPGWETLTASEFNPDEEWANWPQSEWR